MSSPHPENQAFAQLRREFAVTPRRLAAFVKRHGADCEFQAWLNSDEISCREFFACGVTARSQGHSISLGKTQAAALDWHQAVVPLVESDQPIATDLGTLVQNVGVIRGPCEPQVREFVLSKTIVGQFWGLPHQIMFLYFFCQAARNASEKALVRSKILESPAWITGAEVLSCIAVLVGPGTIPILLDAAGQSKDEKSQMDLLHALQVFTGKSVTTPHSDYFRQVGQWYEATKDDLEIDVGSLYPAPFYVPVCVPRRNVR